MRRRSAAAIIASAVIGSMLWAAPASAAEVAVAVVDFAYDPNPVEIAGGDTVTWTNEDPEPHTVSADDGSFSLVINPGESASRVFDDEGSLAYYCKFHGGPGGEGMAGVVQVGSVELPETVHLTGADNVARAIAWSALSHPDGAGFALLGRDDNFADSLASGLGQGKLDAPLLLTSSASLDGRVSAELERLGVGLVYILGGTGAVSPAVEDALVQGGYTVRRVAGADRLRTATAVAETFAPEARAAILVRAFGSGGDPTRAFVDSLAAGALSANTGLPILFSETAGLSAVTKEYLEQHPISSVTVVGGTAALADKVQEDLTAIGVESQRSAGLNRADTARMVNGGLEPPEDGASIVVIDGTNPDGWVDGFAAAGLGAPVLLSSGDGLPGATAQDLGFNDATSRIVCGTTTTSTACTRSEVARDLDLDIPVIGAILDDDERGGLAGAAAANGLYFGGDGTTVCYDYFGSPLEIVAAHIHLVSDGSAIVPMTLEPAAENDPFGCTFGVARAVLADIRANPADYYSNVHTAEFPNGAISGTLTNIGVLGSAGLLGESEVPGPGDPDGVGFAFFLTTDTPGALCSVLFVDLASGATAAHIHEGASDASGPVVVTLQTPTQDAPPIHCSDIGEALLGRLEANPSDFYVNVHTAAFRDGAIRGQLVAFE